MKKYIKIFLVSLILLSALFLLTGCTSESTVLDNSVAEAFVDASSIDYSTSEDFETALNNGTDVTGKIVKFTVKKYEPSSAFGYNAQAGEHLNFIEKDDLNLESDIEVIGQVTSFKKFLGTWIIDYEMIEIDSTVKDQVKQEAEEKAKQEAEAQAKKEAEEKAKQEAEAQAKKEAEEKAKQETIQQTQKQPSKQTSSTSTDNSRGVYRTPSGQRYHFSPTCGGKNSYSTTLNQAISAGLTPCKKCAQ